MKSIFDSVSYQTSKVVTKKYSTSFSLAIKMLSRKIQPDIYALYGFVRLADEIVDSFHDYNKEELLNELERDTWLAIDRKISLNPILNSFQEVYHKNSIEKNMVEDFLKSMRWDLSKQEYNTVKDYEEYIYGSADVVGLICLMVFVNGDKEKFNQLKTPAMKLGSAFQKVNFLRDLNQDMNQLNRNYFPQIKGDKLTLEQKNEIIYDIKSDFDEAYKGIKLLPKCAKFGVYTAYLYYKKLLDKLIVSDVETIQNNRIRVSNSMKFFLLSKSYLRIKGNLV